MSVCEAKRSDIASTLQLEEIKRIIPHREPFLLLSRVTDHEPGKYAIAEWDLSCDSAWFQGHFPQKPILPGVLMLESIAQTGAVAALSLPKYNNRLLVFGGVNKVRFRRQVSPGETLRLEVTLSRCSNLGGQGRGEAYVGDELCCEAEIMFAMIKDETAAQ